MARGRAFFIPYVPCLRSHSTLYQTLAVLALDIPPHSDLSVRRTLKGSSQTHGELSVVVRNNRPVPVRTRYLETMPWHVEFFLHTLGVTCGDGGATKCGAPPPLCLFVPHIVPADV